MQEAAWHQLSPLRLQAGFPEAADVRASRSLLAQARYVDDIWSASTVYCAGCLSELVQLQHPGIPFSLESSSRDGPVRWLDVCVFAARLPVHLSLSRPEAGWLLGESDVPKTFRLPPSVGEAHVSAVVMRAYVRSRLARWGQIRLAPLEFVRGLAYEGVVMLRSGYPAGLVTKIWTRNSRDHRDAPLIRLLFRGFAEAVAVAEARGPSPGPPPPR